MAVAAMFLLGLVTSPLAAQELPPPPPASPVNVDSATAQAAGTDVQFDCSAAGSSVRFVLRRNGKVIGTTVIVEWGTVVNQKVRVLFSDSAGAVSAQAGDSVQAEVVGAASSNSVLVQ